MLQGQCHVCKQRLSGNRQGEPERERQRQMEVETWKERQCVGKKRVHKATGPNVVALLMSVPCSAAHVQSLVINLKKTGRCHVAGFGLCHTYLILEEKGRRHQRGDDVLRQNPVDFQNRRRTVGDQVLESLRIKTFLRKLGSPSPPQYNILLT